MSEIHNILNGIPISCHAFNKNKTLLALSPNDHTVSIYALTNNLWNLTFTLEEHDKLITSLDWAPETNRIVTCSQDRNAYVWSFDSETNDWKPTLVLLRINRAATRVKWSPLENKFAVASGQRLISICYFEEENDWWVSKHLKNPIRSTVTSIDWHPDNILLACGSCDFKARVFSGFIKGIDQKASNPVWGEKLPFGTLCGEFTSNGWIHAIAFSPDGNSVAWTAHDSTVSISNGPNSVTQVISTQLLPFMTILFTNQNQILAAGYDCAPYLFENVNGKWAMKQKIDIGVKKAVNNNTAFNKFKQMDSRAQAGASADTELNTIHQNTITGMNIYAGDRFQVGQVSTSALDGKLVIWDMLSVGLQKLVV